MLGPYDDIYRMLPGGDQSRIPGGVPPSSPVGPMVGPPVRARLSTSSAVPGAERTPGVSSTSLAYADLLNHRVLDTEVIEWGVDEAADIAPEGEWPRVGEFDRGTAGDIIDQMLREMSEADSESEAPDSRDELERAIKRTHKRMRWLLALARHKKRLRARLVDLVHAHIRSDSSLSGVIALMEKAKKFAACDWTWAQWLEKMEPPVGASKAARQNWESLKHILGTQAEAD